MSEERFPLAYTLKSGRTITLTREEAEELFTLLPSGRSVVGVQVPSLPHFTFPLNPAPLPAVQPPWYVGDVVDYKFTTG